MVAIGCIKENDSNEHRVSFTPESISRLKSNDIEFIVESDCGKNAGLDNNGYKESGAQILTSSLEVIENSDIVLSVNPWKINFNEIKKNINPKIFIGNFNWLEENSFDNRFTFLALEKIPRIARAQSMDILSSQASISGYQASLLAANHLNKYFPMLITAAGTIFPAKILVIGAGVAGLQAIATCNRLGAKVTGFDIRESTKEQIESVGGKFLDVNFEYDNSNNEGYAKEQSSDKQKKQNEILSKFIEDSDCVITTAAIPGKKAPLLVTKNNINNMSYGSVVIDLAGDSGGNCELGKYGKINNVDGVIIDKPINITNMVSHHASLVFSRNIEAYLNLILKNNEINLDLEDEIISSTIIGKSKNE